MVKAKCTTEEFISLWNKHGSAAELSKILNTGIRNVHARRRQIEINMGIQLKSCSPKSSDVKVTIPNNGVRVTVDMPNGCIVVGSDCHYWPDDISTAHRAFVKVIDEIKPSMIVMAGDVFDGASVSRHPKSGYESLPNVKQELDACQDRLAEIVAVAGNAKLHWTWGNHDIRFSSRIANQVGDTYKDVIGFNLQDHFPQWHFSTSIVVNNNTQIKHRNYNGIHAAYNATLKSGMSTVNGHLHSLKITPWTDLTGTRFGVDCGSLADVWGQQFAYTEDGTRNHRSGFAVLTYHNGKLMPPELCEVIDEEAGLAFFRGKIVKV
jgi:predicted phosphodiesterase